MPLSQPGALRCPPFAARRLALSRLSPPGALCCLTLRPTGAARHLSPRGGLALSASRSPASCVLIGTPLSAAFEKELQQCTKRCVEVYIKRQQPAVKQGAQYQKRRRRRELRKEKNIIVYRAQSAELKLSNAEQRRCVEEAASTERCHASCQD
eukprot:6200247-Pleurochrysis_carterae.AAC.1